ncbi:MAG: DUF433 domain-containing protein [Bryobacteraceae bacterium]
MASQEYVEEREGGYYLAGSRVSLASVILAFREGASPETIRQNFPSLSLGQVYGAIAFYLDNPQESETYLQRLAARWKELEQHGQPPSGELQERVEHARQRLLTEHQRSGVGWRMQISTAPSSQA